MTKTLVIGGMVVRVEGIDAQGAAVRRAWPNPSPSSRAGAWSATSWRARPHDGDPAR